MVEEIDNGMQLLETLDDESLHSPKNSDLKINSSNPPENLIWEQLQCDIPYQDGY